MLRTCLQHYSNLKKEKGSFLGSFKKALRKALRYPEFGTTLVVKSGFKNNIPWMRFQNNVSFFPKFFLMSFIVHQLTTLTIQSSFVLDFWTKKYLPAALAVVAVSIKTRLCVRLCPKFFSPSIVLNCSKKKNNPCNWRQSTIIWRKIWRFFNFISFWKKCSKENRSTNYSTRGFNWWTAKGTSKYFCCSNLLCLLVLSLSVYTTFSIQAAHPNEERTGGPDEIFSWVLLVEKKFVLTGLTWFEMGTKEKKFNSNNFRS